MRKTTRVLMVATLALGLGGHAVLAQDYPSRPVEVIVPFGAGSGSDLLARVMFDRIGTRLNQRFVIDNRPAAGGNVGTAAAAKAAADGYTLLFNASGPLTINKSLYKSLPYDPEQDFDPVSLVAVLPNIMVASATLPVSSVSEFIAYAKKSPSPLNYSSPGNGTSTHISGAYFAHVTGLKMTHVPYRSTTQLVSDLISGQVPLSFLFLSAVAGPVQTGQLKALAVTSTQRIAALPSTPTMRESGVADYESAGWFAVVAPKGTPKAIVERLNREIVDAIADPAVVAKFSELGAIAKTSTPAELRDFMAKETIKWRDVIASTGITIEQ